MLLQMAKSDCQCFSGQMLNRKLKARPASALVKQAGRLVEDSGQEAVDLIEIEEKDDLLVTDQDFLVPLRVNLAGAETVALVEKDAVDLTGAGAETAAAGAVSAVNFLPFASAGGLDKSPLGKPGILM